MEEFLNLSLEKIRSICSSQITMSPRREPSSHLPELGSTCKNRVQVISIQLGGPGCWVATRGSVFG